MTDQTIKEIAHKINKGENDLQIECFHNVAKKIVDMQDGDDITITRTVKISKMGGVFNIDPKYSHKKATGESITGNTMTVDPDQPDMFEEKSG